MLVLSRPGRPWQHVDAPVAGIDEAGRGCLAGPVVAGAVILPSFYDLPGLTDSKRLSARQRALLAQAIKAQALSWALGFSWPREIERINILQATLQAMARAEAALTVRPVLVLVDGNQPFPSAVRQKTVVGGDAIHPCISAASILAKTFRDRLLELMDVRYPGYGLSRHKGYGTREHLQALDRLGPCPVHRMTFKGVRPGQEERQLCLPGI
ncbi:MAG: ribonuclease HII [Desulfovibrionales bacterium]|nr:ribonuclease HII [Desulfovibrionales bacterium]